MTPPFAEAELVTDSYQEGRLNTTVRADGCSTAIQTVSKYPTGPLPRSGVPPILTSLKCALLVVGSGKCSDASLSACTFFVPLLSVSSVSAGFVEMWNQ